MSSLLLHSGSEITAEITPVEARIAEVHTHIVGLVGQVLDARGFMLPHDRLALDARLTSHFVDLAVATEMTLITPPAKEQATASLVQDIGKAAPQERELAESHAINCVNLAGIILDRLPTRNERGLLRQPLDPTGYADVQIKLELLREMCGGAYNGSIIRHLGAASGLGTVKQALIEGHQFIKASATNR